MINAVRRVMLGRFVCTVLFAFSVCAAFGDVVWPTAQVGKDGDLSSNGADGWNGSMPTTDTPIWFYGAGTYTPYLSNGDFLSLPGTINLRNMSSKDESHVTLNVTDGSHLKLKNVNMGANGDRMDSSMKIRASGQGSTVEIDNKLVTSGGNCLLEFADGARFLTTNIVTDTATYRHVMFNGTGGNWDTGLNAITTNTVTFNDATWEAGSICFGYGTNFRVPIFLGATNSVFTFTGTPSYHNAAGFFDFKNTVHLCAKSGEVPVYYGASVTFDGGAVTNGKWKVMGGRVAAGDSELTFKGGVKAHVQGVSIDGYTSAVTTGRVVVAGAGTDVAYGGGTTSYGYTDIGSSSVGIFDIRDGATVRCADDFPGGMPIRLGVSNGSYGELNLWNGAIDFRGSYGLWIGNGGLGAFNVYGGTANFDRLVVGFSSCAAGTSIFRLSGGEVTIDAASSVVNNNGDGTLRLSASSHASELRLEGGRVTVGSVYSEKPTYAKIVGDGGTLRRSSANFSGDYSKAKKFVHSIGQAECGDAGLTVDTNGRNETFEATSVLDVEGEDGVFTKTGDGILSLSATTYAVAKTVVAGGTLEFGNASGSYATGLRVLEGTMVSFGNVPEIELSSLIVSNATLKIDPAVTRIVVRGPVSFAGLQIVFTSVPTTDEVEEILKVEGEVDEDVLLNWRRAILEGDLADGTHASFSSTQKDGFTVFSAGVKTDAPLTETTIWAGTGSWATPANWTAGVPTAEKIAVFGPAGAGTEVEVGATKTLVGALSFASKDYRLFGAGSLFMTSETGAANIDVTGASVEVDVPFAAIDEVRATVAEGATLKLSGPISEGGLTKRGSGRIELGAENSFTRPLALNGGILAATGDGAIGTGGDVKLRAGTLVVDTPSPIESDRTLSIASAAAADYVCVSNASDVTFAAAKVSNGVFAKRGGGTLTLKIKSGDMLEPSSADVAAVNPQIEFPADGSGPASGLAGITCVEGDLRITSDTPGANFGFKGRTMICGVRTLEGTVTPSITFDGVQMPVDNDHKGKYLYLGRGATPRDETSGAFSATEVLRLIDSTLYFDSYCFGTWCYAPGAHPTVIMSNSCLRASWQTKLSDGNNASDECYTILSAKDSVIVNAVNAGGFTMMGGIQADLDNCYIGGVSGTTRGLDKFAVTYSAAHGRMLMRNGTTFAIQTLEGFGTILCHPLTFVFDNATWNYGAKDFVIGPAGGVSAEYFSLEMQGKGLIVVPTTGTTLTLDVPVTGAGGFVNRGAGTVKFGAGRYQFTGKLAAEAGVIDLSDEGTVENATIGGGAGVIKGATFKDATIALDAIGGAVPTFENCTFTGRTKVVIAGEPVQAENALIANFTGTLTGVDTFRLKGWKGYRGTFAAEDGSVRANIAEAGLLLIVR